MSPSDVLVKAQELGITLTVDPLGFVDFAPPGRVTRELHQAIVANKFELIAMLPQPMPVQPAAESGVRAPPEPPKPSVRLVPSPEEEEPPPVPDGLFEHFTTVPNELFDVVVEKNLDASAAVALFQLSRLTNGFHKRSVVIALDPLAHRCNYARATCDRALQRLADVGLIRREQRTSKGGRQLANRIHVLWRVSH